MEQQTAIEWLVEKITKDHDKDFSSFYKAEIEQAKEMEKEQKIGLAKHCLNKALDTDVRTAYAAVEAYYNQIYNI